jgi:hypothetical protein
LQIRAGHGPATEAGDTDAMYSLSVLCTAQGDAGGALRARHRVIEKDQEDDLVVAAALALAAVSALKADYQFARELLEIAGAGRWTPADTCAAAFDPNPLVRADTCTPLAGDTEVELPRYCLLHRSRI